MKPSKFRYVVPSDLSSAVSVRTQYDDSVVLSGGQSLIATMNFRLSNPDVVIDLRKVSELDYVDVTDDAVRVGAMTRQRALECHESAHRVNPLIRRMVEHIAHPVIRNRGTVGGSLAHADPAAELPCLLTTLRGHVVAQGPGGKRTIAADEFFEFIFTTTLSSDELLVEAAFPSLAPGEGWGFREFTRRHGDFAVAAVAATVTVGSDGKMASVRLGACGIGTRPIVLGDAEKVLVGAVPTADAFAEAAAVAAEAVDLSGESKDAIGYRKHVLRGLVAGTLSEALERTGTPSR